jgi:2-polyprenyl-3-methyl-5-hydroxy-6-metoxy-1,4-benzoquinol methylase
MTASVFLVIPVLLAVGILVLKNTIDHRVYDLERQDKNELEGNYTKAEYMELMHILAESNLADPNGHNATLRSFDKLSRSPESILEIGFGLGHFSVMLANAYPNAKVVGIDAHQLSVDSANQYLNSLSVRPQNVRFEGRRESQLNEEPKSVDVITTTLVNHHIFPDEQFVDFLKRVAVIGRQAFIFNDFHRSVKCIVSNDITFLLLKHVGMENLLKIAAYLPASIADTMTRYRDIFYKDRPAVELVADGGMLSMRRSFSLSEYKTLFAQAGYPEGALQCVRLDAWYETMTSTCRVVCTADLTWAV